MADYIPLLAFVFLGLFSPGPNVILLTSSGARFGFRSTVPHILGVVVGVGIVGFAVGLGLGAVIHANPKIQFALTVVSAAWILYMAYALWNAKAASFSSDQRPFTFWEAVLFQWVNPKIWAVSLAAVSYVSQLAPLGIAIALALSFSSINSLVSLFWTILGQKVSGFLGSEHRWSIFFKTMASLLLGSVVLLFL